MYTKSALAVQRLTGSQISAKERTDSELFYLSQVLKSGAASQEERCQMFRQWDTLCKSERTSSINVMLTSITLVEHGTPDEIPMRVVSSDKLSNHLIGRSSHN